MVKQHATRWIALVLVIVMVFGFLPMNAFAQDTSAYNAFLATLKTLENYAASYAVASGKDANELVLNFVRTRVERYNDDNWTTLAGAEITDFTDYVKQQDSANGTTVAEDMDKMVETDEYEIILPNGNQVDFGHMFGTMNIAYLAAQASADLAGWAGDLCDLLYYSYNYGNVPAGTVEEMADYVRVNCFGVDADDAFGMDDFYGDMDAFYLFIQMKLGKKLSAVMEAYFTAELSDVQRAAFFLNTRFSGLETNEDVREAVYNAYTSNVGLKVLESKRGLTNCTDLRKATCYAFADYLFELAGDLLEGDTGEDGGVTDNEYYTVFSSTQSILAPGISQTIHYATSADGKQMVYYVATVDVTRDDVTIMANYKDNNPGNGWGMQRVEDQANALVNNYKDKYENFSAVVAINADGYNMSTGEPGGLLIMDGVEWHGVDGDGFFAILKDGSAMIGTKADYDTYRDQIQEAVGGFGATLVLDGKIAINKSSTYYSTRASRTAIGIKADGSVVMMVLDGRQEPFSCGGSMEEIAQIMLDAGCVHAINLDGGGSTTYLSKPEGSDKLQLVNRPSDGYARSVATSLVAISTAKPSDEFDHAVITSEYDYLTRRTELLLTAIGVNNIGGAAALPENIQWQVSDSSIGTITQDGLFTAKANGEVEIQLVSDGQVIGKKTLYVVVPDALAFEKDRMTAIYGIPVELPLVASYNGNPVAINNRDLLTSLSNSEAGSVDYLTFTGNEESGIRNVVITTFLRSNRAISCEIAVNLYSKDEAYFDFDNITSGNRTLAWLREVANSVSEDGMVYQILQMDQDMTVDYTFALDMTQIEIPKQLEDLVYMLPGADAGSTAWDFLLQLAERISVLSQVRVTVQIDPNLEADISEMKIVSEYFTLQSATIDENNLLTIVCGWVDQTQAIDSATANPICIVTGLKAVPKEDAAWDSEDQIVVTNTGTVSYQIFLRASSLYSFACDPANQAQYNLIPYDGSLEEFYYNGQPLLYNGAGEKGAYFANTYADFEDSFILDKTCRQGWAESGSELMYYVNNEPVTGLQYLPSFTDPSVMHYYTFDENGVCQGLFTGKIEKDGKLYYAAQGILKKGWQSILDPSGESFFYYFDPYTYAAVGGEEGWIEVEGYRYYFADYKCLKGSMVETAGGLKYRYAGLWQRDQWIEWEGNWYFIAKDYYAVKGGFHWIRAIDGTMNVCHLFDENGVWLQEVYGTYDIGEDTYWVENGIRIQEKGLVYFEGYYYYFAANAKAVKNRVYWPTITNGLLPVGPYNFDEYGRITNVPGNTPAPEEPEVPENPEEPEEKKNGIVYENGGYYYYIDGEIQYGAGLILIGEDYYYIRSNGQAAIGNYWITKHNDLLPMGMYTFGPDGKMIQPGEEPETPEEPEVPEEKKNGIVNENGVLYYYVDGNRAFGAGVVKLTDEEGVDFYIYVRSNSQLATGIYWPTVTNGLLNYGQSYDFGADGKYYPSVEEPEEPEQPEQPEQPEEPEQPEVKNGIIEENGVLYYYVDGIRAYGAGVLKLTDENGVDFYIYVRSNGQLATGIYWPTVTNGLLNYGQSYDFGTDGRLYL